MSDKLEFYGYLSNETIFNDRNWKVGDELDLPSLFGWATFKLTNRTEDALEWVSGKTMTRFRKREDVWVWNHCLLDMEAVAKIEFV